MKKAIPLFLLLLLVNPVYAQGTTSSPTGTTAVNTTTSPTNINVRNEVQDRLNNIRATQAAVKEEVKEKISQTKEMLAEKRKALITNFYYVLKKRLEAAVERLKKLGTRISSRLDKLTAQGYDVSALKVKLADAQTKLSEVEKTISLLDPQMTGVINSETPKVAFEKVRNNLKEIKQNLKDVHQEYVEIIVEIKALLPKTTVSPTLGSTGITPTLIPTKGVTE